ncbi:hypothetical protein LLEC1_01837 [Akanthomyces lecanii]|uniref:Carbohydrate-binding module family 19 domain-containing protein n=1 Tax=Cordyceps confragosa TaxID=2714763 RepID=A0A179IE70_CORDF|nr:hypothetical protein LLEC1_01837 [Akanthomyces lecanii]
MRTSAAVLVGLSSCIASTTAFPRIRIYNSARDAADAALAAAVNVNQKAPSYSTVTVPTIITSIVDGTETVTVPTTVVKATTVLESTTIVKPTTIVVSTSPTTMVTVTTVSVSNSSKATTTSQQSASTESTSAQTTLNSSIKMSTPQASASSSKPTSRATPSTTPTQSTTQPGSQSAAQPTTTAPNKTPSTTTAPSVSASHQHRRRISAAAATTSADCKHPNRCSLLDDLYSARQGRLRGRRRAQHAPRGAAHRARRRQRGARLPDDILPPAARAEEAPANMLNQTQLSCLVWLLALVALSFASAAGLQDTTTTTATSNSLPLDAAPEQPLHHLQARQQSAGSACSDEGQWNCMTSSWQRCASGRWSVTMPCAKGTTCYPAGLTHDFRIQHDGSVNNGGGGSPTTSVAASMAMRRSVSMAGVLGFVVGWCF